MQNQLITKPRWVWTAICLLIIEACVSNSVTTHGPFDFSSIPDRVPIIPGQIDEASGVADSRTFEGHLWVQEDSGTPAQLNLLARNGNLMGRLLLPGVVNRDWEDIAIGPGPESGRSYLYIADIGDNLGQNEQNYIYRLAEPKSLNDAIGAVDRIAFRYPDGPRDAEALLIDPLTRDLWVVTKGNVKAQIYHLPYPQNTSATTTAMFKGELSLPLVTSGTISPNGGEIILKTYLGIHYWARTGQETIDAALLNKTPSSLTYQLEPQGEAICFDKAGTGFFTLSERGNAASVTLNYYRHQ